MLKFKEWAKICQFHNVRKNSRKTFKGVVQYRAKVKLHGTNAGVCVLGEDVCAQSRSRILQEGNGHYGFGNWVESNKDLFIEACKGRTQQVTIFGEWCGPGVQKGVALAQIPRKIWAVFGAKVGEDGWIVEPSELKDLVPKHPDIFVLPWYASVRLDFSTDMENERAHMNALTEEIDAEDPWVKEHFHISGVGEGLVWYPDPKGSYFSYSELMFKTKGSKHSVVKQREPAQICPEKSASVEAFVEKFVTPQRLQQVFLSLFGEDGGDAKGTGKFIGAMLDDVRKESEDELEVSGMVWNDVKKSVGNAARVWYQAI